MKKKFIITYYLFSICLLALAQKPVVNNPISAVYKILADQSVEVKDSLAIYALNFELSIVKNAKGTNVTKIAANDSLAFIIFPTYKKFTAINFSPLMGGRNKLRLIIPILIFGSSPGKKLH